MNDEPTRELSEIILNALKWSDRRLVLGTKSPLCPQCATKQVQLTNHFTWPAEWKCRDCKTLFEYEP